LDDRRLNTKIATQLGFRRDAKRKKLEEERKVQAELKAKMDEEEKPISAEDFLQVVACIRKRYTDSAIAHGSTRVEFL